MDLYIPPVRSRPSSVQCLPEPGPLTPGRSVVRLLMILGAVAALGVPSEVGAQDLLRRLLVGIVGVSDDDVGDLRSGEIVSVVMDGSGSREMATFGGYVVDGDSERVERPLQGLSVLLVGTITDAGALGTPPTSADVRGLTLGSDDLEAARRCEPGRCDIKVSTNGLARLRTDIQWGRDDELEQLNALARAMVVEYATAYLAGGDDALAVYHDKDDPQPIVDGLLTLIDESAALEWLSPGVHEYLRSFPQGRPEGASDYLYWAIEDFGLRPVTTLNHATVHRVVDPLEATAITMKQLYATHYFQAALRFVALIEDPEPSADRTYVLQFARYLFDDDLGWLIRRRLRGHLRDHLRASLEQQRALLGRRLPG